MNIERINGLLGMMAIFNHHSNNFCTFELVKTPQPLNNQQDVFDYYKDICSFVRCQKSTLSTQGWLTLTLTKWLFFGFPDSSVFGDKHASGASPLHASGREYAIELVCEELEGAFGDIEISELLDWQFEHPNGERYEWYEAHWDDFLLRDKNGQTYILHFGVTD